MPIGVRVPNTVAVQIIQKMERILGIASTLSNAILCEMDLILDNSILKHLQIECLQDIARQQLIPYFSVQYSIFQFLDNPSKI